MTSAAGAMRALLDDLVEHGRLDLEKESESWFDATKSLKDVLGSLNEIIESSHAVITHDELPTICASPVRFSRLLQNLIGNAIKYVAPGVAPRIHVSTEITPAEWIFSVADNGIGIDPRGTTAASSSHSKGSTTPASMPEQGWGWRSARRSSRDLAAN
jgi:chemotaxis family two-component system sensor kinase Cph1